MELDHLDASKADVPGEWPEHFQGVARIQPFANPFAGLAVPNAAGNAVADGPTIFAVHFEAGGRSRPHTHRAGQILYIASGEGVIGGVSGRRHVRAGDVVSAMPGEWHWHGATPDSPMIHVTVQMSGPDSIDWDVDERDWADDYEPGAGSGST